jgi:hypothetical protein
MTNTTATFSKLSNGSWGIKAPNLVSGQTVTVVKRSGETSEAVVGTIVERKYGNVFATIARPEAVVTAEVTVERVTEVGFYRLGDDVYKVVPAKSTGRLYAQKVSAAGFVYDRGAIFKLSATGLMTAEEVRIYSRTIGICANCSIELSDPISVEIGLGTTCGPNILGRETYNAARRAAKLVPEVAEALAKIKAEKAADAGFIAEAISFEEAMIESELEAERRAVEAGMI